MDKKNTNDYTTLQYGLILGFSVLGALLLGHLVGYFLGVDFSGMYGITPYQP